MDRPDRTTLIAIARRAVAAYDGAERAVVAGDAAGRVGAGIGRGIWPALVEAGLAAERPSDDLLGAVGGAASLAIDAADRGRIHGAVDDVYEVIGSRIWRALSRVMEAVDPAGPVAGGLRP